MSGIYLHIPFCDTKCIYCDFYSITNHSKKNEFIDSLLKEIEQKSFSVREKKFDTIFFGGGTPSLLSSDEFKKIFDCLYKNLSISADSEITIEANPGTLNYEKLNSFRELPVNRISFGVQSFNDADLKFLSRIHSSRQAINAVKLAQDVGYSNLSIDLIFALPSQSFESWNKNLELAVSLGLKHLSAYSLIFEEGTPLFNLRESGKVNEADIELEAKMYEHTINFFESNGFTQYEISNFAKENFECRHNLKYWTHQEYIAFGPSASSYVDNHRWTNVKNLNLYITSVNEGKDVYEFKEFIDRQTAKNEFIFLGLRSTGINLTSFKKKFGNDFFTKYKKPIDILTSTGFASLDKNYFRLTSKGYIVCDEIAATYF
jgi:oxygen-independent coproporphyrinogen-3 oxidase